MGPKNVWSYADIEMTENDNLAKSDNKYKELFWWRYRDDRIEFWTDGLEALHKFTNFIYQLYSVIEIELVILDNKLNVLGHILHLVDGFVLQIFRHAVICIFRLRAPITKFARSLSPVGYSTEIALGMTL